MPPTLSRPLQPLLPYPSPCPFIHPSKPCSNPQKHLFKKAPSSFTSVTHRGVGLCHREADLPVRKVERNFWRNTMQHQPAVYCNGDINLCDFFGTLNCNVNAAIIMFSFGLSGQKMSDCATNPELELELVKHLLWFYCAFDTVSNSYSTVDVLSAAQVLSPISNTCCNP